MARDIKKRVYGQLCEGCQRHAQSPSANWIANKTSATKPNMAQWSLARCAAQYSGMSFSDNAKSGRRTSRPRLLIQQRLVAACQPADVELQWDAQKLACGGQPR